MGKMRRRPGSAAALLALLALLAGCVGDARAGSVVRGGGPSLEQLNSPRVLQRGVAGGPSLVDGGGGGGGVGAGAPGTDGAPPEVDLRLQDFAGRLQQLYQVPGTAATTLMQSELVHAVLGQASSLELQGTVNFLNARLSSRFLAMPRGARERIWGAIGPDGKFTAAPSEAAAALRDEMPVLLPGMEAEADQEGSIHSAVSDVWKACSAYDMLPTMAFGPDTTRAGLGAWGCFSILHAMYVEGWATGESGWKGDEHFHSMIGALRSQYHGTYSAVQSKEEALARDWKSLYMSHVDDLVQQFWEASSSSKRYDILKATVQYVATREEVIRRHAEWYPVIMREILEHGDNRVDVLLSSYSMDLRVFPEGQRQLNALTNFRRIRRLVQRLSPAHLGAAATLERVIARSAPDFSSHIPQLDTKRPPTAALAASQEPSALIKVAVDVLAYYGLLDPAVLDPPRSASPAKTPTPTPTPTAQPTPAAQRTKAGSKTTTKKNNAADGADEAGRLDSEPEGAAIVPTRPTAQTYLVRWLVLWSVLLSPLVLTPGGREYSRTVLFPMGRLIVLELAVLWWLFFVRLPARLVTRRANTLYKRLLRQYRASGGIRAWPYHVLDVLRELRDEVLELARSFKAFLFGPRGPAATAGKRGLKKQAKQKQQKEQEQRHRKGSGAQDSSQVEDSNKNNRDRPTSETRAPSSEQGGRHGTKRSSSTDHDGRITGGARNHAPHGKKQQQQQQQAVQQQKQQQQQHKKNHGKQQRGHEGSGGAAVEMVSLAKPSTKSGAHDGSGKPPARLSAREGDDADTASETTASSDESEDELVRKIRTQQEKQRQEQQQQRQPPRATASHSTRRRRSNRQTRQNLDVAALVEQQNPLIGMPITSPTSSHGLRSHASLSSMEGHRTSGTSGEETDTDLSAAATEDTDTDPEAATSNVAAKSKSAAAAAASLSARKAAVKGTATAAATISAAPAQEANPKARVLVTSLSSSAVAKPQQPTAAVLITASNTSKVAATTASAAAAAKATTATAPPHAKQTKQRAPLTAHPQTTQQAQKQPKQQGEQQQQQHHHHQQQQQPQGPAIHAAGKDATSGPSGTSRAPGASMFATQEAKEKATQELLEQAEALKRKQLRKQQRRQARRARAAAHRQQAEAHGEAAAASPSSSTSPAQPASAAAAVSATKGAAGTVAPQPQGEGTSGETAAVSTRTEPSVAARAVHESPPRRADPMTQLMFANDPLSSTSEDDDSSSDSSSVSPTELLREAGSPMYLLSQPLQHGRGANDDDRRRDLSPIGPPPQGAGAARPSPPDVAATATDGAHPWVQLNSADHAVLSEPMSPPRAPLRGEAVPADLGLQLAGFRRTPQPLRSSSLSAEQQKPTQEQEQQQQQQHQEQQHPPGLDIGANRAPSSRPGAIGSGSLTSTSSAAPGPASSSTVVMVDNAMSIGLTLSPDTGMPGGAPSFLAHHLTSASLVLPATQLPPFASLPQPIGPSTAASRLRTTSEERAATLGSVGSTIGQAEPHGRTRSQDRECGGVPELGLGFNPAVGLPSRANVFGLGTSAADSNDADQVGEERAHIDPDV